MEIALNALIGIGLAATCGFRVFVPLLALGVAGMFGYVNLGSGFQWIATYPAIVALSVATLAEVLAYFFPYVDNLLVTVSSPLSIMAGVMAMAAVMTDVSPALQWSLAIIAGGGAATASSLVSNGVHHSSTVVSGGIANPLVSAVESVMSVIMSILSILVPILAVLLLVITVVLIYKFIRKIRTRFKTPQRTFQS